MTAENQVNFLLQPKQIHQYWASDCNLEESGLQSVSMTYLFHDFCIKTIPYNMKVKSSCPYLTILQK